MNFSIVNEVQFLAFWLAFSRWIGVMINIPLFDNSAVPFMTQILTSLILTYCFFGQVEAGLISEIRYWGVENLWYLTGFYTLTGLIIGYTLKIIMGIFVSAGSLMTQQMGFSSLQYFDPSYIAQIGPIENLIKWTLTILILTSGALLPIFKGTLDSFAAFNLSNLANLAKPAHFYYDFFKSLVLTSLLLSSPILFSNLLLNMVLGIVARTVPQMNILMVSFVVNIGIGLVVFMAISEEFFFVAYETYVKKLGEWFTFIT